MPRQQPSPKSLRPDALAIFTDRIAEQEILRKILAPGPSALLGASALLTQFYGVGGVGKSTLCQRACEIASAEFKDAARVIATSFDDSRWKEGSAFTEVSAELCRCLAGQKIVPRLTLALLSLHGQQTGRNGEVVGGLDSGWEMAFTAMEKGADLTGIPGLGMMVKGAQWVRERSHRQSLRQRLTDLGLWPEEQYGKLNILDLEKKLSSALYYDLLDWLKENPGQHVRLLLDGFERLQSSERREDSQRRLQDFIGYFAGPDERDACDRFRVVIFGRNQLRWDEIYEDPTWRDYWNLHLLGGLAEADALDFLKKTRTWLASKGQSALAEALVKYEEKILDASDETKGGQRIFYPFYLNLAVELVERARQSGQELELGRAPAELQDRFFRYLEPRELRALMILALSEVFDESLFDWLARERLIEYPQHCFHSQLRREHSYLQAVEGREGDWRFHRLMEDALHARWQSTTELKRDGVNLVKRLMDYYGAPLLAQPERDWADREVEVWRRGMEIIVKQGPELGMLPKALWEDLLISKPWLTFNNYRCDKHTLDFKRRILKERERLLGPGHPDTLNDLEDIALLYGETGDYDRAEALHRQLLKSRETILGPEHPDTLFALDNLAHLLSVHKDDYEGAEALYRRGLAVYEKTFGSEHLDTLTCISTLGVVLRSKSDYEGSEALLRRALAGYEKTLGAEHPTTCKSAGELGFLLRLKGDMKAAVAFDRRAQVVEDAEARRELSESEKAWGAGHPMTLIHVRCLGLKLYRQGDNEGAEALFRRALAGYEKALGPEHPSTLDSANDLGQSLNNKGDKEGAEALFRRAVAGFEKALGLENGDTLRSIDNLASLLEDRADYKGAEALCRQALAGSDKAFGQEHPDTLCRVKSLAHVLEDKGDYEGAETLFRRALYGSEKVLGPEHPDTFYCLGSLGGVLCKKGDYERAEEMYLRALAGREKVFGQDDPVTLKTVACLGGVFHNRNNHDASERLYRRALAAYEKIVGPEHPETLKVVSSLGDLLHDMGDNVGAEAMCRRALHGYKKTLGPKHPDTLKSMRNLADLIGAEGDCDGAETLYREALGGMEQALGTEHPETLFTVARIGFLLSTKSDYARSEAMYRRALAGYEKAFGPENPKTLTCVENLAVIVKAKGNLPSAVGLLREFKNKSPECLTGVRYLLACYECLSGSVEEAKRLIAEEIAAKPAAREQALKDDDLKAIHDFIHYLEHA